MSDEHNHERGRVFAGSVPCPQCELGVMLAVPADDRTDEELSRIVTELIVEHLRRAHGFKVDDDDIVFGGIEYIRGNPPQGFEPPV